MKKLWSDTEKYKAWLEVELAVCEFFSESKIIPKKDWANLKKNLKRLIENEIITEKLVQKEEKITKHDVIAFTTVVAKKIGPSSRWVHFSLTSSDVVDTAQSLLIQKACDLLLFDIKNFIKILNQKARQYKKLPCIGRSHGMFAEPTAFGLKFLSWSAEWRRNYERLKQAKEEMRFGKLSGAVGVNAHLSPAQEKRILSKLSLKREPVSTQVIPRDRYAEFFSVLALCGSSLERIAVELRHLQRSEVGEVREGFSKGQKGSSAMPHKRNPISSENLTGCARLLRSYAQASYENVSLWHERDISHSSVERVILPDATILLDYALQRMLNIVDGLVVNKEAIQKNLTAAGTISYSGHLLLTLVSKGVSREKAYAWIQDCALKSLELNKSFQKQLEEHEQIKKYLKPHEIKKYFSIDYQLRNVSAIYKQLS